MDPKPWLAPPVYGYLADVVVALHLGYVSYIVFGVVFILLGNTFGWAAVRSRRFRLSHLVMMWIVAVEAVLSITCPLTTLEGELRAWAKQKVEERTFVGRMMDRVLFPFWPEKWSDAPAPPPVAAPAPPAVTSPPAKRPTSPPAAKASPVSTAAPPAPTALTPAPPAAFPVAPPAPVAPSIEFDFTTTYVFLAVFISMLYVWYPPHKSRRAVTA